MEKDSDLYKKLEQSTCLEDVYPVQGAPSISGAETIVAEVGWRVRRVDSKHETFVVDIPYHIASPRIPGSLKMPSYDAKDVRHGYWKVTFGKWGRVVALERASAEEFGDQQTQQQPKPDLPNVGATLDEKPEKGLIYLPFDDDFKNRYDNTEGTAHGNVPFGSGVFGNAAYFDGGEGYLDLGTGYNLSGDFTCNVWLKPDADNEGRNDAGLLAKYQTNSKGPYDFYLQNNAPAFWITSGSKSLWYVADNKIPSDAWSMVTYMYSAANKTLNVYINGELAKSFSNVEASNTNDDLVTVGRQAYMFKGKTGDGGYNDSEAHLKYKGWMDDLLLLDYTLSESYIRQIYESGAGSSGNNPPSENPNPAPQQPQQPQQPEQPQQPAKDTANVSGTTWYYAHIAKSQMGGTSTYRYGYSSLEFLADGTVKMTGGNDLNLLGHDGSPEDFDWSSLTPFSWTGNWTTNEDGTITIDNVKGPLDMLTKDPTRLRPTEQNGERVLRADEDTILTEGPGNLYSTFDRAKEAALASL